MHNSVADTTEDKNRPTVRNGDTRTNYASEHHASKIFSRHLFMPVCNGSAHLKRPMEWILWQRNALAMVLVGQLSSLLGFLLGTCQLHRHENRSGWVLRDQEGVGRQRWKPVWACCRRCACSRRSETVTINTHEFTTFPTRKFSYLVRQTQKWTNF